MTQPRPQPPDEHLIDPGDRQFGARVGLTIRAEDFGAEIELSRRPPPQLIKAVADKPGFG